MFFYSHPEFIKNCSEINYDIENDIPESDITSAPPFYKIKKTTTYPISRTTDYALYLLSKKTSESTKLACSFLKKIFDAQITDMQSEYYGVWLYDFIDTIDDYVSPDYIHQSKVASILLEIYLEFKEFLPQNILLGLQNALSLYAFVVIHHSNEIDSSSALLEILTIICIGEQFGKTECVNFAVSKMQTLVYYTLYNDAYMEYNYPAKIIVFLETINFFRKYISNPYCLNGIQSIKNVILTCFYSHFNPTTLQWTGPISSADYDFLPEHLLMRISDILASKNLRTMKIPPEYSEMSPALGESFNQLLVTRGFSYPHWKYPTVASFYNTSEFSLGSFNRDDLWMSRRPCIAYFGTAQSPYCLRVRCLLNGHDFSSATLHSVQHKGNILGHITFSTNRGNINISTDRAKSYKMTDLRLRFQILGDSSFLECSNKRNSLSVLYKALRIYFSVDYTMFDDSKITFQFTTTPDSLYFDAVLYNGEETELNLSQYEKAIVAFSLLMANDNASKPGAVKIYEDGEYLISEQKTPDVSLKLKTPQKPNTIEYMTMLDRQYINNVRLEKHVDTNKMLSGQYRFIAESNISPTNMISTDHFSENKAYLTKIKNLNKIPLDKIDSNIHELMNGLNNLSLDIARRYSIHIIANVFDSAKQSDIRFKNIIETKYSQVYDEISYTTKISKIKKIISDIVNRLQHDYQRLLANTKKSDKIARVIKIIESDYSNPNLSLQIISSEIGISQAHLSREFHSTIGSSYVSYLLKVRMEHAKKLLAEGMPIEEVMTKCGYISDVTFNAAFKRYTGTTAKKYLHSLQSGVK